MNLGSNTQRWDRLCNKHVSISICFPRIHGWGLTLRITLMVALLCCVLAFTLPALLSDHSRLNVQPHSAASDSASSHSRKNKGHPLPHRYFVQFACLAVNFSSESKKSLLLCIVECAPHCQVILDAYHETCCAATVDANNDGAPDSVEAANGPTPQNSSSPSQLMIVGVKAQKLHTAQWNLDRVDQTSPDLNQTYL